MDSDVNNFRKFCLLCATPSKGHNSYYTDIFSNTGKTQNLLEKIHRHLTIKVTENDGMPHGVCHDCISKLNVCHDLVVCSEEAHAKLLSLKAEWIVKNEPDLLDDDYSYSAPESFSLTSQSEQSRISSQDNIPLYHNIVSQSPNIPYVTWENSETHEIQMKLDSSLEPFSQVVLGSQMAFFYADKEEKDVKPFVYLVVINFNQDTATSKQRLIEKMTRIAKNVRRRTKFLHDHYKTTGKWETTPTFSCQTCKCSFFLKEEMESHFESLHPNEVTQCSQCGENVCGPNHVLDKHMELHKGPVEDDESYILLNMCTSQLDPSLESIEPEFIVIPLGDFHKKLHTKTPQILSVLGEKVVQPSMHSKIIAASVHFIEQFCFPDKWKQVQCTICNKSLSQSQMEDHIKLAHDPTQQQCCHCDIALRHTTVEVHVEKHHAGGKSLICQVCDKSYRDSGGQEQPHMMTPESFMKFKCPFSPCKLNYQEQSLLDSHIQNVHNKISGSKPNKVKIVRKRKRKKEKVVVTPPRNSYDMEKYQIPGIDLTQHKKTSHTYPKYKCSYTPCNNVYKLFHKLKAHIHAVHIGPVYCDICGKTYKNKLNVKDHMKFVHFPTRGAIICHVCGKPYANRRSLKLHVRNVHDTKIPCEICGKEYSQKQMKEHKRIQHDGIKFQCKYCGKFLNGKVSLKRHEAIHEGVKLCCDICKPKLHFTTESIMKKHMLKHKNGEEITIPERLQPVKCPICYKEMACRSLKDHMKLKHSNARTLASLL